MKSHQVLTNEILACITDENVNEVINIIENALEPSNQKKELQLALTLLRINFTSGSLICPAGFYNILGYSFLSKSKKLREILMLHDLIPLTFYERKDFYGRSPLALAVILGDCEYVEDCLKKGANPDEITFNEVKTKRASLLELAVEFYQIEMIELLIKYEANVSLYGSRCICLLFNAEHNVDQEKRTQALRLLINHGANVLDSQIENRFLNIKYLNEKHDERRGVFSNGTDEQIALLEKEVNNRKLLNKTIPLFFWATQKDEKSHVYGIPREITQKIASFARNRKQ